MEESSSSAASSASVATQPETQESALDASGEPLTAMTQQAPDLVTQPQTQLQSQSQHFAPPSSLTQMTTENALGLVASQSLATQPPTQMENESTGAAISHQLARQGGDSSDGHPLSQLPVAQPVIQPANVNDTNDMDEITSTCQKETLIEMGSDGLHTSAVPMMDDATGRNYSETQTDNAQSKTSSMHSSRITGSTSDTSGVVQKDAVDGPESIAGNANWNSNDTPAHVETTRSNKMMVANPYTRNKRQPTSAGNKRPFDQMSSCSSNGSIATVVGARSNNDSHLGVATPASSSAAAALPRKQVPNPYAKSIPPTPRHPGGVKNPYAKKVKTSAAPFVPSAAKHTVPQMKRTTAWEKGRQRDPLEAATTTTNNTIASRRVGISISLPIAERLPSRNVSYQPAEICSVGELYRYLYHAEKKLQEEPKSAQMREYGGDALAREMVSVRITGTLLCVSSSHEEAGGGGNSNVYNCGTFLLIGDPLDNTRFMKKRPTLKQNCGEGDEADVTAADNDATPAQSKSASKGGLTSILRNKKTSLNTPLSTAARTPGCTSNEPHSLPNQKKQCSSVATTTPAMGSNNPCDNTANHSKRKPMLRGGILNTSKRKKLVYNGGSGKRLSFGGGEVGGSGSGGGGLGRKFVTPKRLTGTLFSGGKRRESATTSAMHSLSSSLRKRSTVSSMNSAVAGIAGAGTSHKNPKPEHLIQHHPSPIVPVWIGSSYNGDGLDGSVVGDLVMVVGEIVMERCACCDFWSDDNNKHDAAVTCESNRKSKEGNAKVTSDEAPIQVPPSRRIQCVVDAAAAITACASKISNRWTRTLTPQTELANGGKSRRTFCNQCTSFIKARLVKNANGTDMCLQKEALRVRRGYMTERKRP